MPHISKTTAQFPDKPAIIMGTSGQVVTFKQLDDIANQAAHLFRQCGLENGDHICLMMENCREFLEIYMGAMRCGLTVTPVNAHLKLEECQYIVENSASKLIICSDKYRSAGKGLVSLLPDVDHFYCAQVGCDVFGDWAAEVSKQPTTIIPDQARGWTMLYSSGTTGQPKGIRNKPESLGLEDLHPMVESLAAAFGFNEETVYLSPGPLYHAAPLGYCDMSLNKGATVVVMEKYDSQQALELIEKYKVTHSQWVPIMFIRMLKLPEAVRKRYDLSSLKVAIHAAAPCPVEIKEEMIDWWGNIVFEYYSTTESAGGTAIDSIDWLAHKGSVGKALYGTIHIIDDEGKELPPHKIGQIYFESEAKFSYFGEPEKTKGSYNSDGWATLGDVGYLDEEGYLYLTDRKNFMIISGGVNIYPQEIENCLILHEKVADVAVFGVPNEEFGEEVCAVVQAAEGVSTDDDLARELIIWCRERISNVKSPKQLHFIDELPRLENGKLYKRWLIEKYSASE